MLSVDTSFIGPPGWAHLVAFGVLVPWMAIHSRRRVVAGTKLPTLTAHFVSTLLVLVAFGTLSWTVAKVEWIQLFPAQWPALRDWLVGAVVLATMIGCMVPVWRSAWCNPAGRDLRVRAMFAPRTATERLLWLCVSLFAGVSEEITWRGVQWTLSTRLVGSALLAAALCVASFTVAHAVQGRRSMSRIAAIAAAFHFLVWLSESLVVAMAVHFLYDVAAGLAHGYFRKRHEATVGEATVR
ncbi:MAG: CPBP family intramembrane glutamic endopeptidase [Phycisphaerales bacterium]